VEAGRIVGVRVERLDGRDVAVRHLGGGGVQARDGGGERLGRSIGRHHSALILASRMIWPYFADSSSMYFANSAVVDPIGSKPIWASLCLISGVATAFATSAWSFAAMSAGKPFGPQSPYHEPNAKPFIPDSSTVGMSGAAATRLRLVTASGLILPDKASGSEDAIGSAIR